MAPFHVSMRHAERRILRDALEAAKTLKGAATLLGITRAYYEDRSIHLGGVLPGQPAREPPGKFSEARENARAEGTYIGREAAAPPRRFGKTLKRPAKEDDDVSDSNGEHPLRGVRSDSEGTAEG